MAFSIYSCVLLFIYNGSHSIYNAEYAYSVHRTTDTHSTATQTDDGEIHFPCSICIVHSLILSHAHSLIVSQYILRSRCRRPFVRIRIQFCIRLYHLFGIVKMKIRCRSIYDDDFAYMRRTGINNCHCRWCRINLYSDIVLHKHGGYAMLVLMLIGESPFRRIRIRLLYFMFDIHCVVLRADADIDYVDDGDGVGCHFVLCFVFASMKCYHIATQYPKPFISSNSHYAPNTTAL